MGFRKNIIYVYVYVCIGIYAYVAEAESLLFFVKLAKLLKTFAIPVV